jgi:uncharacterized protein (TIGR03084 family)
VDPVVTALAEQQIETQSLLDDLADGDWEAATRCDGWNIADVVLHLAQSDEMAVASLQGTLPSGGDASATGWGGGSSVDESVALMVERERGAMPSDLVGRWTSAANQLTALLDGMDLSTRVRWVAGHMSARTLATTRMAETWIHTGDIASAVGIEPIATDRLKLIARLAWRTLPYAFGRAGKTMSGPVKFLLVAPSGERWGFIPDEPAVTTIFGPAVELCEVAARRVDPSATSLSGDGPDVAEVLSLVRTYA